jgi:hypothetical protein
MEISGLEWMGVVHGANPIERPTILTNFIFVMMLC